jgi:FkbM family methyltransferase
MKEDTLRGHTFHPDNLPTDAVVVDLGSHKGEFLKLFSDKYSFDKLIAIEANPDLIYEIKETLKDKENIVLNAVASAKPSEKIDFFINPSYPEASSSLSELANEQWWYTEATDTVNEEPTRKISIQGLTIEQIMHEADIDHIDLLKVDIEGGEWELLMGFDNEMSSLVHQISVEFHDFYGKEYRTRTKETIEHLKNLGYKVISKPGFWGFGTPFADTLFYK